jgi:hypothetical protein
MSGNQIRRIVMLLEETFEGNPYCGPSLPLDTQHPVAV